MFLRDAVVDRVPEATLEVFREPLDAGQPMRTHLPRQQRFFAGCRTSGDDLVWMLPRILRAVYLNSPVSGSLLQAGQTLDGSCVSKPIFASGHSFGSSRRDLHKTHLCVQISDLNLCRQAEQRLPSPSSCDLSNERPRFLTL